MHTDAAFHPLPNPLQVIATSAVPKINPLSLVPVLLAKLFKKEGVRPTFTFKEGQVKQEQAVGCVQAWPSC